MSNNIKNCKERWNQQRLSVKIAVSCCVGLILLIGLVAICTPDKNYTNLKIEGAQYDQNNHSYFIDIGNDTKKYVIKGCSEANATVTVESEDLKVFHQKLELDSNDVFNYEVDVPEGKNVKLRFTAEKEGKTKVYLDLLLKRPAPPTVQAPSAPAPPVQEVKQGAFPTCPFCGALCNADFLSGEKARKQIGTCPNCGLVVQAPVKNEDLKCEECKEHSYIQLFHEWQKPTKYWCMNCGNIGWANNL